VQLLRGVDEKKDQTYFLHTLTREQLTRSLFPLGTLAKHEVREIARDAGFTNHAKKDSTGICFIGERRFSEFLAQYLQKNPGEIRTLEGQVIGAHDGLMFYTIGQRQGLGIGGRSDASGEPWYVVAKDTGCNVLYVAQGVNHPALFKPGLRASQLHWIAGAPPPMPFACEARIRHQQALQPCTLEQAGMDDCFVRFLEPQRAITPGQSVVCYQGDVCLGGGIIEAAIEGQVRMNEY
jgi:tRNA-specific 2-thiouridylase